MANHFQGGPSGKRIARRDFLKAAGFPAIIPASALGAGGTTAPSDRINMACIGVGRMGGGHVRSFARMDDVRVVAICDVQETARRRAKNVVDTQYGDKACATYNDFRELFEHKDLDALMLAPGERWTPIIGAAAARRGLHMYYEKPLALTVANAKAIRDAVHRSGVVFQFGTQQRSTAYFRTACELARNGRIGQLQKIVIGCSGPGEPPPPERPAPVPEGFDWDMWLGPAPLVPYSDLRASLIWLNIYDYGLGSIGGSWGVHDLDIAQWVNNSDHTTPISIDGTGTLYDDIRDTVATWDVEYTYANGVKVHFMNRTGAQKQYPQFSNSPGNAVVLIGSEGWIWVAREGIKTHPEPVVRSLIGPNDQRVVHSDDHRRNFLDAIRTGRPTLSTIEVAAHDEMMCQMCDIVVRLKRKLRWDPVKEEFIDDAQANRRLSRPMRSPWRVEAPGRIEKS
jgi:predicted dehydrogenase